MNAKKLLWRLLPPPFNLDKEERKRFADCLREEEWDPFMSGEEKGMIVYRIATGRDVIVDSLLWVLFFAVGTIILLLVVI